MIIVIKHYENVRPHLTIIVVPQANHICIIDTGVTESKFLLAYN